MSTVSTSSNEHSTLFDPTGMDGNMDSESSHLRKESLFKRSWNALADSISPFSSSALKSLPRKPAGLPDREIRTDHIPEPGSSAYPGVRDYNSVNSALPPNVPVPQKVPTTIRVEGKVWFANERSMHSCIPTNTNVGRI
jgi:hypothetical protein